MKILFNKKENYQVSLVKGTIQDKKLYKDVLLVRNNGSKKEIEKATSFVDPYSDIYCLYLDKEPIGTITTTHRLKGKLECEEFFPKEIIEGYKTVTNSASMFRILTGQNDKASESLGARLSSKIIKEVLKDQFEEGILVCICKVERYFVEYYRRMGFVHLEDYDFINPWLGYDSCVMILSADPNHKSSFKETFANGKETLLMSELFSLLPTDKKKFANR